MMMIMELFMDGILIFRIIFKYLHLLKYHNWVRIVQCLEKLSTQFKLLFIIILQAKSAASKMYAKKCLK